MTDHARAVGGPLFTGFFRLLALIFGISLLMLAWRFASGIGATSGLSDGYPWGIWIAFDVVTGTALACGGYAVALLCYVFNKGKYHPLVRPAILTSALGYSLAGFAISVDVGRYWGLWKIPVKVNHWNLNSALLEVALCVMAYIVVLWIELSPAFMEKWKEGPDGVLKSLSEIGHPLLNKVLIWIIALGLLLPTMHQSSLGSVMLLAHQKLHALWYSPFLPLMFLVSCLGMGYAVVVFESTLSSRAFGTARETGMLASLSGAMVPILAIFICIRFADVIFRGQLSTALSFGRYSLLFWCEILLFLVPMIMLASKARRASVTVQFNASLLMIGAGILYRFDTYLVAFSPGPGWTYFPSLPEVMITLGILSLEIMLYVFIVKRYPILSGGPTAVSE